MSKDSLLEEIVHNTREILRWIRFQNLLALKNLIRDTLKTRQQMQVYEFSDGKRSQSELEAKTGVPQRTISDWLQHWYHLGIVDLIGERYERFLPLADLGISIPKEKEEKHEKVASNEIASGES